MSNTVTAAVACERCERLAEFETPHGLLCRHHAREVLHSPMVSWSSLTAEPSLWIPQTIDMPGENEEVRHVAVG